ESMLNLLAHSRRNRSQHYEAVMQQPVGEKLDLRHGNHPLYQALARDAFISRYLKQEARVQSAYTKDDVNRLFADACQLVAEQFGLSVADLRDPTQRRRFHHLMPLEVWCRRGRGGAQEELGTQVDDAEQRLALWLRKLLDKQLYNVSSQMLGICLTLRAYSNAEV